MANTSSRTLRLLSLLQNHRYWPGAELAERLEVSARTLRRDVDRLRELGYPVEAHRGVDGGYQLAAGVALPPLVLDDDEAVALAVGLHAAAHASVAGIAEASISALTKVVQMMPKRLRHRVDALRSMTVPAVGTVGGAEVDAGLLTGLAQACRDTDRVGLVYTDAAGTRTDRHVEPHRVVSLGRRWYLVAYDLTRHDWRCFRLDRIAESRPTGLRFRPRDLPAQDAAEFVRARIDSRLVPHTVEAVVHAAAGQVRGRIGQWAEVVEVDERRCRIRMHADTLDWPAMALGSLSAAFEIVGPAELADHLRDWAERFGRAAEQWSADDR